MTEQIPTIGRIVHYRLSADDATNINHRRTAATNANSGHFGAQAHIGNEVKEGDTFPMMVTRIWNGLSPESLVNGQTFLDGNDVLWTTSVKVGEGPRTFSWPQIS